MAGLSSAGRAPLTSGAIWLARHWLGVFVVAAGVFALLPLAAPVLAAGGHSAPAAALYSAYRITCHQMAHRSFFVGGPQATYSWAELQAALGTAAPASPYELIHRPLGTPQVGYQSGFCQRDTAIYVGLFGAAAVYAWNRRRGGLIGPLSITAYVLAMVPIGLDGGTQLVGLRESTPLLRLLTGALFGCATAFLVLPRLDEGVLELLDLWRSPPETT